MQYLHRLTSTGLTIASVIHQPRIEVFLGVDDVIFLGRGGRLAYYGAAKVSRAPCLSSKTGRVMVGLGPCQACYRRRDGCSHFSRVEQHETTGRRPVLHGAGLPL